jgi:hypothetical protein
MRNRFPQVLWVSRKPKCLRTTERHRESFLSRLVTMYALQSRLFCRLGFAGCGYFTPPVSQVTTFVLFLSHPHLAGAALPLVLGVFAVAISYESVKPPINKSAIPSRMKPSSAIPNHASTPQPHPTISNHTYPTPYTHPQRINPV